MSDIPMGSPPAPPGRHAAPGGWYPDPVDPLQERYWDGWQWSRNTRLIEGPAQSHPQQPYQQQPYQQQPYQHPYPQQGYGQQQGDPYGQNPYAQQPPPGWSPQQRPAGLVLTADGVPVAGWWWRVLAVVVDSIIVGLVAAVIALPIYLRLFTAVSDYFNEALAAANAGQPPPPQPDPATLLSAGDNLLLIVISLGVALAYNIAFLRWKRATPGKLIVGLRVVPVDQGRFDGQLAWSSILARVAVWVLPTTTAWLYVFRIADVLFPLWQPKKQALHDLAAKTQVIKIN